MLYSIGFKTFLVQAFKVVGDSWKFSMLLLDILWDNRPIFLILRSNEQLQQQLEYTLLKLDCHSWWITKIKSKREEERYAIKFCFKLGKNATETYGMLQTAFRPSCINRASVFEGHKIFKEGRESVRDDEKYERSKEVNTPDWLAKGVWLRLGLLCWGFKKVQGEILSEEASTLQIGSVAFPPGQCTSSQLHPCQRLFDHNGHQDSSLTSLQIQLEYTLLRPDCHSWWIAKMQSDTLEERYVIKFCLKLEINVTEAYGLLQAAFRSSCMNRASVFEGHKSLWGKMRGVGGVRKSIHQA